MIPRISISSALAGLAFVGLSVLYLAWAVCGQLTDLGGDSATYMLMAREWSPLSPSYPPLGAEMVSHATFPPLFPALIALLGGSFAAAHVLVTASLLFGFLFFYRWLRALDLDAVLSSVATLLFALLPVTYLLALKIWSENTYLCLSLVALWASSRARSTEATQGKNWCWIAASATAAAMVTRTAGLPLGISVAAFIAIRRPKGWPLMIATVWAPLVIWAAWSRLHAGGASLYAQQLTGFYRADALHQIGAQLSTELPALMVAWLQIWMGESAPWSSLLVVAAFGLVSVSACVMRLLRGHADAIYATLYIAMLALWPWPSEATRLLYPVCPVLIGHGLWAIRLISSRLSHNVQNAAQYAVVATLVLLMLPSLLICAHRRLQNIPEDVRLVRHIPDYYLEHGRDAALATALLLTDLQKLPLYVGAADCVFTIKPSVVVLLTNRRALFPPPMTAAEDEFRGLLSQCRFAYLMNGQSPTFPESLYPRSRLSQNFRVLSTLRNRSDHGSDVLGELVELPVAKAQDR